MIKEYDSGAYLVVVESSELSTDAIRKVVSVVCPSYERGSVELIRVSPEGDSFGVDKVRSALACAALSSSPGKKKVLVFEKAESLTLDAQNCLLKRLEEPPDQTLLLLITSNLNALIPTVRSRCQLVEIRASIEPGEDRLSPEEALKQAVHLLTCGEANALVTVSRMSCEEGLQLTEALVHLFRRIVIDLDVADSRLRAAATEAMWLAMQAYGQLKQNANPGLCLEAMVARLFRVIPDPHRLEGVLCLS
ncbi:MAG: hypothetical protein ACPLPR_09980 [Bacillota bacterium]